MRVEIRTIAGCPHAELATERMDEALRLGGFSEVVLEHTIVESAQHADRLQFQGLPTFVIDGRDPFASPGDPVGLTCRLCRTGERLDGCPTVDALRQALNATIKER